MKRSMSEILILTIPPLIIGAIFLIQCHSDNASSPAPEPDPNFHSVEHFAANNFMIYRVLHDDKRNITCWAIDKMDNGIALSCMPDSQFKMDQK